MCSHRDRVGGITINRCWFLIMLAGERIKEKGGN